MADIKGNTRSNILQGGETADVLSGDDGGDALAGGSGADVLHGGGGDDLLFVDQADTLIDGGEGIDTVVVTPSASPYTIDAKVMTGVEALQDAPGADTSVTLDAGSFADLSPGSGDHFLFALGDGDDSIRITNASSPPTTVENDRVVFENGLELRFEGVENLVISGTEGETSNVVVQSSETGNSATVSGVSTGNGVAVVGSTTVIEQDNTTTEDSPDAPTAAATAAETVFPLGSSLDAPADLTDVADTLTSVLEDYHQEANAVRAEALQPTVTSAGETLLTSGVFDTLDLLGLLSGGDSTDLFTLT